jgi:hypothetical protein
MACRRARPTIFAVSYRTGRFGCVFYVVWQETPDAHNLAALEPLLREAAQAHGAPVSYVTVLPSKLPVPTPEQRKALDAYSQRVRPFVEHAYMVVEGEGFGASIHRSVIIGLIFWKERGLTTVCKRVQEALHQIAGRVGADEGALGANARRHHLLGG